MTATAGSAGRLGERLLTGGEMAAMLGCSVETLRRWRRDGVIKNGVYHRKGQRWVRYDARQVLDDLKEGGLR